jgi:DNA-binding MarR family transcriptional regulator
MLKVNILTNGVAILDKKTDILGSLVLDIFRASNLLERVGRNIASGVGLSSTHQWFILGALAREGELPIKEIRNNTLVTKQNMTGMIERLEQGGYVTKYEDPADRRVTYVKITSKGIQALNDLHVASVRSNEETFRNMNSEELAELKTYFNRLIENLKKQTNEK